VQREGVRVCNGAPESKSAGRTHLTTLPSWIEPIEMPWPPEQKLPRNLMLEPGRIRLEVSRQMRVDEVESKEGAAPLLMARQSSWFQQDEFWIVRSAGQTKGLSRVEQSRSAHRSSR
jgi:hypothetical protein